MIYDAHFDSFTQQSTIKGYVRTMNNEHHDKDDATGIRDGRMAPINNPQSIGEGICTH